MNSIVSYLERGKWGNNKYRGNATGKLLIDLHKVYKFQEISDYMSGSFTTEDVGKDLGIITNCYDLNGLRGEESKFDLIDDEIKERNNFIYWHPPYWDIIKYSGFMYGDAPLKNDLSHIKEYSEFIRVLNYCLAKQYSSLKVGGRMAILMADVKKNQRLYSMLLDMNKLGTVEQIVIKEQHNCMSDNKIYSNSNFIRIAHEYCIILRKDEPLILNYMITKNGQMDLRDSINITWKDLVADTLEHLGGKSDLNSIYSLLDGHKKTESNINWKAKVRQTLQVHPKIFNNIDRGRWSLAS
ncbi:DNA methyltransferase [uncultured Clostridium sp.]|nr:DNA methyltransferase [uncultured Clostridium sp.]